MLKILEKKKSNFYEKNWKFLKKIVWISITCNKKIRYNRLRIINWLVHNFAAWISSPSFFASRRIVHLSHLKRYKYQHCSTLSSSEYWCSWASWSLTFDTKLPVTVICVRERSRWTKKTQVSEVQLKQNEIDVQQHKNEHVTYHMRSPSITDRTTVAILP